MSFVYVLINQSMPGLVKIGMTTKRPDARAAELQSTGVPTPFEVAAIWEVPANELQKYETKAHQALSKYRLSKNREFFKVEPALAIKILKGVIPTLEQIAANKKREEELVLARAREAEVRDRERTKEVGRKEVQRLTDIKRKLEAKKQQLEGDKALVEEALRTHQANLADILESLVWFLIKATVIAVGLFLLYRLYEMWAFENYEVYEKLIKTVLFVISLSLFALFIAPLLIWPFAMVIKMLAYGKSKIAPSRSNTESLLSQLNEEIVKVEKELASYAEQFRIWKIN